MAPRLFTKDTKEYSIVHFRFYFQHALDKPRIQLTAILCLSISLNILKICLVLIFGLFFNSKCPRCRDAYAGGQEGQLSPLTSSMGSGRARIALHTEVLPSLLSWERTFYDVIDGLTQENFSGESPHTPNPTRYSYDTSKLNTVFPEKSLKTSNNPCRGTYMRAVASAEYVRKAENQRMLSNFSCCLTSS